MCVFGCRLGMEILLQHCQTLLLHDMTHEEHIQVVRHLKSGMHNEWQFLNCVSKRKGSGSCTFSQRLTHSITKFKSHYHSSLERVLLAWHLKSRSGWDSISRIWFALETVWCRNDWIREMWGDVLLGKSNRSSFRFLAPLQEIIVLNKLSKAL